MNPRASVGNPLEHLNIIITITIVGRNNNKEELIKLLCREIIDWNTEVKHNLKLISNQSGSDHIDQESVLTIITAKAAAVA